MQADELSTLRAIVATTDPDSVEHRAALDRVAVLVRENAVRRRITRRLDRARAMGAEAGDAAGSWVVDPGRRSTPDVDYAAGILRALEDGTLLEDWSGPLSGEYADGTLPRDVLDELGVDEDDDAADEYLSAYEDGYWDALRERVERDARALLRG